MLQNNIYRSFFFEIVKTFLIILVSLSMIALTVKAVNFLDLIVNNGYSVSTYFFYSGLNFFGILTKFIPLSFLLSLTFFILKQLHENEFVILWTSGVAKFEIVKLLFISSLFVMFFHLLLSIFITPYILNESRNLLNKENYNSFVPTIRTQQFSNSFKGFTFFVDEKSENQIKKVFIFDNSGVLEKFNKYKDSSSETIVTANEGIVKKKQLILFNGMIISVDKKNNQNDSIVFDQLNIELENLKSDVKKIPKIQETSTAKLFECFFGNECDVKAKKEVSIQLNRRIIYPFYIPVISIICSFMLLKIQSKRENLIINRYNIFGLSFLVLIYAELIIRYSGNSKLLTSIFFITPFLIVSLSVLLLKNRFKTEYKNL